MSAWLSVTVWSCLTVAGVAVLLAATRAGKPLRRLFASFVQGVCAIAAVNIAGVFTGVSLGFGWFPLSFCTAFGVPGVISMLLMRLLVL